MSKPMKIIVTVIILAGIGYGGYVLMGGTRGDDGGELPPLPTSSGS